VGGGWGADGLGRGLGDAEIGRGGAIPILGFVAGFFVELGS